jgi:hypothetical protein
MINTCGDCEYYFRGICNAGRCPISSIVETDCSDFKLVDRKRRREDQEKLQSKVTIEEAALCDEYETRYQVRSLTDLLQEQFTFIYRRFGVRPTEFLIHPYTLRVEMYSRVYNFNVSFNSFCRHNNPLSSDFCSEQELHRRFFHGMAPIVTSDIEQNTVLVLVPIEVVYGRNSHLTRPFRNSREYRY